MSIKSTIKVLIDLKENEVLSDSFSDPLPFLWTSCEVFHSLIRTCFEQRIANVAEAGFAGIIGEPVNEDDQLARGVKVPGLHEPLRHRRDVVRHHHRPGGIHQHIFTA